jgi:hypothetical protein
MGYILQPEAAQIFFVKTPCKDYVVRPKKSVTYAIDATAQVTEILTGEVNKTHVFV